MTSTSVLRHRARAWAESCWASSVSDFSAIPTPAQLCSVTAPMDRAAAAVVAVLVTLRPLPTRRENRCPIVRLLPVPGAPPRKRLCPARARFTACLWSVFRDAHSLSESASLLADEEEAEEDDSFTYLL